MSSRRCERRTVTNSLVCECTISRPVIKTFMPACLVQLTLIIFVRHNVRDAREKMCYVHRTGDRNQDVWPDRVPASEPRAGCRATATASRDQRPPVPPRAWARLPAGGAGKCQVASGEAGDMVPPPRPSPRHAACVDKTRYMKTVYAVAVTATALTRCSERAHLSTLTHCTTQSQSLSPNSPLSSVLSIAKTASPPQHQPPWTMTARDTHLGRSSPLPYAAILCTRIHLARLC